MKNPTVTIGIPAYNEEQNIDALLRGILDQKLSKCTVKEIIVYSDASSDKTDKKVAELMKASPLIKLIKGKSRKGKYYRMNQLFAACKTDILIIMDADIAMVGKTFLDVLTRNLLSDKNLLAVSAKNIFVRPKGFTARVLHRHFTLWDNILLNLLGSDAPGQFSGTATAFRGSYARKLAIPSSIQNPHLYLYLAAHSKKGFRYCQEAKVLQYVPSTVNEVKTVLVRKIMQPDEKLYELFGKETISSLQQVPKKVKIHAIAQSFIEDPFYTPLALVMMVYIKRASQHLKKSTTQLWEINTTTKREIAYEK